MDVNIAMRMDARKGNPHYDAKLASKASSTARAYIESGVRAVNQYISDFDAATDIVEMLQPVDSATSFAKVDRTSALCFRHPAAFTQAHVATTFLAEILFGSTQCRSVEAQGQDDDNKADDVNAVLAWNDRKIKIYSQGWLWIWNAWVYNRGIWYEDSERDCEVTREPIEEEDITKPKVPLLKRDGSPRMRDGQPIMVFQKRQRMRNKRVYSGFYNAIHLVSPYDFICDPSRPILDFQTGRYAGHRLMIPWHELKRRSELEPEDDDYVLPQVVWKVKNARENAIVPASLGGTPGLNGSRTYYERTQRATGIAAGGIGGNGVGAGGGSDGVDKDDGGTIECFALFIRAKPSVMGMYDDDEFEVIKLLVTSSGDVLSLNVQPNKHDQFPYAPAESIPNGFRQFTPGFGLKCKPIQDRIDNLNTVHTTAQARMGNILVVDDTKCDVSNLTAPDKNGLMIQRRLAGSGLPVDDLVKQIPLTDTTANYNEEMAMWEKQMENMTGANSYVQGQSDETDTTLGEFDATRQMSVGRISSIARMLAEQGLMPQTRRFVLNFQQFGADEQTVRILGRTGEYDPSIAQPKYKVIRRADIQGQYDVVPHDGSLPGADAKIVAAAARTIEAYSSNPALAKAFDINVPGSIDPVKVLRDLLEKSGLPIEKYSVTLEEARKNAMAVMASQGIFQPVNGVATSPASNGSVPISSPAAPMVATPNGGIPSASTLPPIASAAPPMLNGRTT